MSRKQKAATKSGPDSAAAIKQPPYVGESTQRWPLLLLLRLAGFGFLTLTIISSVKPGWRLWGFHYPSFLPEGVGVVLLLAGGVLLTPLGSRIIEKLLPWLAVFRNRAAWLWAIAAFFVFFGLRVTVPLLGDSQLWIRELTWIGEFSERGSNIPLGRIFKRKEPLSLAVHEAVFYSALKVNPVPREFVTGPDARRYRENRLNHFRDLAQNTYASMSMIAGALTLWLLIGFVRRRISPEGRTPFLLMLACGGGPLLFFGYIENYSWTSFWVIACLLSGIEESLPPRRIPRKTVVTFLIALGFHYSSIILLPGVLLLLINLHFLPRDAAAGNHRIPVKRAQLLALFFMIAGVIGYFWVSGWKGWISIIPLLPQWSRDGYSFVSGAHGLDLFNLFCLLGLATVTALVALKPANTSIHDSILNGFLTITASAGIVFVLVFNPNLGMARDWDLLAVALWPMVIAASWRAAQVKRIPRPALIATLCGVMLLVTVPSILVNAMYTPSVARYKTLLALDDSRAAYGWENMALHYQRRGEIENRVDAWRHAVEIERNPRYVFNYADAMKLEGRLEDAVPFYLEAARAMRDADNKVYREQLLYVAAGLIGIERFERAREVLNVALEIMPDHEYGVRLMAMIDDAASVKRLISAGKYSEAQAAALKAREKDPQNSYWVRVLNVIRNRQAAADTSAADK
jgi:Tfp pilus assembly protein PilF